MLMERADPSRLASSSPAPWLLPVASDHQAEQIKQNPLCFDAYPKAVYKMHRIAIVSVFYAPFITTGRDMIDDPAIFQP